jgi:hypothetical protein
MPLNIPFKPARSVLFYIFGSHLFAILAVILADAPSLLVTFAYLVIVVSLVTVLQRQGIIQFRLLGRLFPFKPITHLRWDSDNLWEVTVGGKQYFASLMPTSVRYSKLLILDFKLDVERVVGSRRSAILTGNNMPERDFRQLRIRLGVTPP